MTTLAGARFAWVVGEFAPVPLSAADAERAAELDGVRAEQFLRGRAALAAALRAADAGDAETAPARCPDCGRRHGGPEFAGGSLHGSVSHAGSGSLAAVADAPVGVDVEDRAAWSVRTGILPARAAAPRRRG